MTNVILAIVRLVGVFKPYCGECSTLDELAEIAADRSQWRKCHNLFNRIRTKTLSAERTGDQLLGTQYLFEESCAKTLYNLSGEPAPFDREISFRIVPNALALARARNISDAEVVRLIMA
jgi:hypothetical protein